MLKELHNSPCPSRVDKAIIIIGPELSYLSFEHTRSYAALRAANLDWILKPGYSLGGYILGCSQSLASCLRHSARIVPDLLCHCRLLCVVRRPFVVRDRKTSSLTGSENFSWHTEFITHRGIQLTGSDDFSWYTDLVTHKGPHWPFRCLDVTMILIPSTS